MIPYFGDFELKALMKGTLVMVLGGISLIEQLSPLIQMGSLFLGLAIGIVTLLKVWVNYQADRMKYRDLLNKRKNPKR